MHLCVCVCVCVCVCMCVLSAHVLLIFCCYIFMQHSYNDLSLLHSSSFLLLHSISWYESTHFIYLLPQSILEHFLTLEGSLMPIRHSSPSSICPVLGNHNLLSVCMDLSFLDNAYQWNHIIQGILRLTSLVYHNVFKVHLSCIMLSVLFISK